MTDQKKIPRLRQSLAKTLIEFSPARAWEQYLMGDQPGTEDQNRGTLLDQMLFGVEGKKALIIDYDSYRTNAAKALKADAEGSGMIPVLRHKWDEMQAATKLIRGELRHADVELDGKFQVSVEWDSIATNGNRVPCAGRLDHLAILRGAIDDLKTTKCASPAAVQTHMLKYGAHIQHEAYLEAIETLHPELAGRVTFRFIFVEYDPPFAPRVVLATPAGSMRALGAQSWRRAVDAWERGTRTGYWPGYTRPGEVLHVEAPNWAINAALLNETDDEDET